MMRVSTQEDDKGYTADAHYYEVFVDGKLIDNCVTADTETNELVFIDEVGPAFSYRAVIVTGLVELRENKDWT